MNPAGWHHSEETKRKISIALRGNKNGIGNKASTGIAPWNKGLTKETDERVRQSTESLKGRKPSPSAFQGGKKHPMYGKHHTEEWKRKVSKALKGRKFSEERCQNMSKGLKGHSVSEEGRRNMSKAQKRRYQRPEEREKVRRNRLKQILPTKGTSIEIALHNELNKRGIVYKKNFSVCGICQPDIVFPELKIVVCCDGDYWHNLPKVKARDKRQEEVLKKQGWSILRFWEHEIKKSPKECVLKIIETIGGV